MHDEDHRLGNRHGTQYRVHKPHLVRKAVGERSGRLRRIAVAGKIRRDASISSGEPLDQQRPFIGVVGIAVKHQHDGTCPGDQNPRADPELGEGDSARYLGN
jgi:hypothetical protein